MIHNKELPDNVLAEVKRRRALAASIVASGKQDGEYHEFVGKLFKPMDNHIAGLMHAAAGIAGEGGEILDAAKKAWVYNKDPDYANIIEELGDELFYIYAMCLHLGVDLGDVIAWNRVKLGQRYPDGVYTDQHAQARADKVEERKFMRDDKSQATSGYMQAPQEPSKLVSPHTDGVFAKPIGEPDKYSGRLPNGL